MNRLMLIINLGSTSSKFAIYNGVEPLFTETLRHAKEELAPFPDILSQHSFRQNAIMDGLAKHNFDVKTLAAVVGRGGLTSPLPSGTYLIDEHMLSDLKNPKAAKHAASLSSIIAYHMAKDLNIPAYTVDSVVTDELEPVARISGQSGIERKSIFHALNQKSVARKAAEEMDKPYEQCRFIVAHMGGGVSVGAHRLGRTVDVNNALDGDGPFSPERSGGLPLSDLLDICFSGKYTKQELYDSMIKKGGFFSYLGLNDGQKIEELAKTDENAALLLDAFSYQVCKEIGACAAVLEGQVDAILLTGGLAYSKKITADIEKRVSFIAPIKIFAGENEMLALAEGGLRCLTGDEQAKKY